MTEKLRGRRALPVIKGSMRKMIVVQAPDSMFQEALFVLRDDYFQTPGLSQKELLTQARQAAQGYVEEKLPPSPKRPLLPTTMSVFFLGAAAAVFALWIGGII